MSQKPENPACWTCTWWSLAAFIMLCVHMYTTGQLHRTVDDDKPVTRSVEYFEQAIRELK
jgi:hypothetical protein